MLISKKELLAETGISYGQLYRWKREGLIPDEWFQKQSSYTGQETFFDREQILTRIGQILALKDEHSLDEIRELITPAPTRNRIDAAQLAGIAEADEAVAALYARKEYSFLDLALLAFASTLYRDRHIPLADIAGLLAGIAPRLPRESGGRELTVYHGGGSYYGILAPENAELLADERLTPIASVKLDGRIAELKLKYRALIAGKE